MSAADDYERTGDVMDGLRYIASSPLPQYGGFHPNTVKIASDAIAKIERLETFVATYSKRCHDLECELAALKLGQN